MDRVKLRREQMIAYFILQGYIPVAYSRTRRMVWKGISTTGVDLLYAYRENPKEIKKATTFFTSPPGPHQYSVDDFIIQWDIIPTATVRAIFKYVTKKGMV